MRRCLLRRQYETPERAFCRFWQRFPSVSFKDRFRRHLTTPYGASGNSLPPKISRLLPGSDDRLEAYAEGRSYTRSTPQLAVRVREALELYLATKDKRQTETSTETLGNSIRQTVNDRQDKEYSIGQTEIET